VPEPVLSSKRESVSQFAGVGCFIQGLGILAPIILGIAFGSTGAVAGVVVLLVLFVVGSSKAKSWRCGNCKNPIASAEVKLCPACRAELHK
jgi:hypothetical protein